MSPGHLVDVVDMVDAALVLGLGLETVEVRDVAHPAVEALPVIALPARRGLAWLLGRKSHAGHHPGLLLKPSKRHSFTYLSARGYPPKLVVVYRFQSFFGIWGKTPFQKTKNSIFQSMFLLVSIWLFLHQ